MNNCIIKKYTILLFVLLISVYSFSQEENKLEQDSLTISGVIKNPNNAPLADVSVSIADANISPVITDENGKFEIVSPSDEAWLVVNVLDPYQDKEVFINGRKELVIYVSRQTIESGSDQINVGNQVISKRDIVSSHSSYQIDKVHHQNIETIDQGFQGKITGMLSRNHSGMPGKGAVSYLRGVKSIHTSNTPLYIVDGMPVGDNGLFSSKIDGNLYNPLTNIDPLNIASITVLKDPIYTSMYGTKASNGVILIETLEPKATQTTIDFHAKAGYNLTPDYIPQLNGEQYKTLAGEVLFTSHIKEEYFEDRYPGLFVTSEDDEYHRYKHNTNWQKPIFNNSMMQNAYLSVKGGGEIARYGLSVGYLNKEGVLENSNYNRFNVRFSGRMTMASWFRLRFNTNLVNNSSNVYESALVKQTNPIYTGLSKPSIMSPYQYDDEGQQLSIIDDIDELGTSNPLAIIENFIGENKNYRFLSSLKGEADISKHLKFNSLLGLNYNAMKETVFMPNKGMALYEDEFVHSIAQSLTNDFFSFYTDNYFLYKKRFDHIHDISATSGLRVNTNKLDLVWGETQNLPENDQYTTLSEGERELRTIGGNAHIWNWMSLYGKVDYKLLDKYILNLSGSFDFSSRIGKEAENVFMMANMPIGSFYSAGVAWRISNEDFLKNVHAIEDLKLRVSYGITGNDDIGSYNALDYYRSIQYRELSGLIQGSLTNEKLTYESQQQIGAGLDFSLKDGRTRLTADFYIINSEDMLFYAPQSSYTGFEYQMKNAGKIQNMGQELSIYQQILNMNSFKWEVSTSVSHFTNEVIDLDGSELITKFEGGEMITREGSPISSFYGYEFEGVYATSEEASEANLMNNRNMEYGPGDAIYADLSGPEGEPDGVIDRHDKTTLGSPLPEFFGSLTNTFTYGRWSLDVMFQFVYGNEIFNYVRYQNENMIDLSNQSTNVLKRWQKEGDETEVPRASWGDPIGNSDFSSRWIEDGSYLRIKNVVLSYTVPKKFLMFRNADFYVTAKNLHTWDNYLGYDPEFSYSTNPMLQGIDYGLMPQYTSFMIGVKLGL